MPRTTHEIARHPAPHGAGCLRLCAALAAALLAARAPAAEPARGSLEAGLSVVRLGYEEHGPTGAVFDRETGFVPAATVALELHPSPGFFRASASAGAGDLRYEGHLQSTNAAFDGLPVETTSGARLLSAELRAGAFVDAGRRLAPYAGAAWHAWDRAIAGKTVVSRTGSTAFVPDLDEAYSWVELLVGARCTLLRTERAEWQLDARLLRLVSGSVVVRRTAGDLRLDLGARTGGRIALAVRVAVAPRWHLVVEGHGALWRFGASEVDPVALVYEPDSESRTAGMEVRAGTTF